MHAEANILNSPAGAGIFKILPEAQALHLTLQAEKPSSWILAMYLVQVGHEP